MPDEAVDELEILLVEDNVADLLLMMKFLKESSVANRVNVVRNGLSALDYLKRTNGFEYAKRPDLIFLDLNLPLKDGREVLKEVKSDEELRTIATIIMTTSSSYLDILDAYKCKADYYMIKPKDIDQMISSMKYMEDVWLRTLLNLKKLSRF